MANEIYDSMYTKQYAASLDILSQQQSKLADKVWNKGKLVGSESYFNQLEPIEMTSGRGRNAATALTQPEYGRRRVTPTIHNLAMPLDNLDLVQTLVDPKSELAQNGVYAAGRAKDKAIWGAIYGNAYAGVAGGTTKTFDANMIVDVQEGGSSSDVGLNQAKLTKAVKMIMAGGVDIENPMNELTLCISSAQWADWMAIQTLTSEDYIGKGAISTGRVMAPFGIKNVVITEMTPFTDAASGTKGMVGTGDWATGGVAIDTNSTTNRAVTLFCKSAIGFGTWDDIKVKTQERPDLNNIWQLWMEMQIGATRLEEKKVVMIECAE